MRLHFLRFPTLPRLSIRNSIKSDHRLRLSNAHRGFERMKERKWGCRKTSLEGKAENAKRERKRESSGDGSIFDEAVAFSPAPPLPSHLSTPSLSLPTRPPFPKNRSGSRPSSWETSSASSFSSTRTKPRPTRSRGPSEGGFAEEAEERRRRAEEAPKAMQLLLLLRKQPRPSSSPTRLLLLLSPSASRSPCRTRHTLRPTAAPARSRRPRAALRAAAPLAAAAPRTL